MSKKFPKLVDSEVPLYIALVAADEMGLFQFIFTCISTDICVHISRCLHMLMYT